MNKKIRHINASAVAFFLIMTGFTKRVKRKAKRGDFILSIYFHSPSKPLFEFCIKWLKKNGFRFLSQQDILAISQKKMPFPNAGVVITIDDGWKTNEKNIVGVANKYEVPVTIFISTDPIENGNFWWPSIHAALKLKLTDRSVQDLKQVPNKEREEIFQKIQEVVQLPREALTINQVKEIVQSKFITIGSHTISHPVLINCKDEKSYIELKLSKEKIEGWINSSVNYFAYPNGDYSKREIQYLKDIGYALAYTTEPAYLTGQKLKHVYELPRFCIFENISKAEAICRILGIWQRFIKYK